MLRLQRFLTEIGLFEIAYPLRWLVLGEADDAGAVVPALPPGDTVQCDHAVVDADHDLGAGRLHLLDRQMLGRVPHPLLRRGAAGTGAGRTADAVVDSVDLSFYKTPTTATKAGTQAATASAHASAIHG